MSPHDRERTRARSLTTPTLRRWNGLAFRPFTIGTLELCRELGVEFVDTLESLGQLTEPEAQRQIFLFLFIHGYTAPGGPANIEDPAHVNEMLAIVRLPPEEFRRDYLIPFAMPLPVEGLLAFIVEWLADINKQTLAGLFEIVKRLAPPSTEQDPPNS